MRVARLVLGIITIILSVVVFIMGIVLSVGNTYDRVYGEGVVATQGGGWQIVLAAFFLAGGIVMVACHKKGELGGCIACTVIFAIGALIGIIAGWGNVLSVIALIVLLIFSIVGIPLAARKKRLEREAQIQQESFPRV